MPNWINLHWDGFWHIITQMIDEQTLKENQFVKKYLVYIVANK